MISCLAVLVFGQAEVPSAVARTSASSCGKGRNAGNPQPAWWRRVRPIVVANLSYFPPGLPIPYIGAWIERESGGRHGLVSSLGEVGYFQLHPQEIDDMLGKGHRTRVANEIKSSPTASIRWGGHYLSHYDKMLTGLGVKRGTNTYLGLMKALHWNPVHTPRWVKHVLAGGDIPDNYGDFINAARLAKAGVRPRAAGVTMPESLPSCSAFYVLERAPVFRTPLDYLAPHHTSGAVGTIAIAGIALVAAAALMF